MPSLRKFSECMLIVGKFLTCSEKIMVTEAEFNWNRNNIELEADNIELESEKMFFDTLNNEIERIEFIEQFGNPYSRYYAYSEYEIYE